MYCPRCGEQYEVWAKECPDCLIPLQEESAAPIAPNELVTVYTTGNAALIAIAKSILEDAGIPYFAKGEGLQDLFGAGRLGVGFNSAIGPVEIQVAGKNFEEARMLLQELDEPPPDDDDWLEED